MAALTNARKSSLVCLLGLATLSGCAGDTAGSGDEGGHTSSGGAIASGGTGPGPGTGGMDSGGSGGDPGVGGSTGGTGPSTGGVVGIDCESADVLCETFDAGLPSGEPWAAKTCTDGSYVMKIGEGQGASGTDVLLTSNASSSANTSCPLHADLGELDEFWVRARLKVTGANPSDQHEVTFFELGQQLDADDPELRIGYRGDSSCNNNGAVYPGFEIGATSSASGEFTGCTGEVPLAETWYCIEVHVEQSGAIMYSELHVDGTKLDTLVHSQPEPQIQGNFKARYLKVGMQSYGGVFDGLLIDEIAVSSTRLPCQ